MTENDLRRSVAGTMSAWVGGKRGGPEHLEILEIYNGHTPLARGHRVTVDESYCATTVSAAWIKTGVAGFTGTECSCNNLIAMARERGIWVERDDYVPQVGDAVLYDWDDDRDSYPATDCTGRAEHIGIVVDAGPDSYQVAEGNMGGNIGTRRMHVNGRYIRGYICPDYAGIAEILTRREEVRTVRYDTVSEIRERADWALETVLKLIRAGALRGEDDSRDPDGYPARLGLTPDALKLLVINDRMGIYGE